MATYTSLQSDIAMWMHRSDLTSAIPSFIALAEEDIYKSHAFPLRVREMEDEADLVVANLTATLPDDFLEARYIKLANTTRDTIFYMPPEKWKPASSGYFTIIGTEIRLPTGVSNDLKLVYYAKPDPLATTATNAVLDAYYGAYLKASLKYAYLYTKDAQGSMAAQAELDAYLGQVSGNNKPVSAGPLQVVPA